MMKHGCCCHAKEHTEDSMGMYWRVIAAFLMLVGGSVGTGLEVEFFSSPIGEFYGIRLLISLLEFRLCKKPGRVYARGSISMNLP